MVQRHAIELAQRFDTPDRLGNGAVAYVVYLIQLFWPFDLTVLYPHPAGHLPSWMVGASALLLAAISILMWLDRRRRPYLLVGWLWFLGMLVPVIGLVQVGIQAHADRYTYLPQIGICLLLTWLAANLVAASRGGLIALRASAVATVAALMILAHEQTRHWRDSVSLWSHALVTTPTNSTVHYHLGRALGAHGRLDEAAEQYEQALQLDPNYDEARLNLGVIQYTQGKLAESIRQYDLVLQRRPEFVVAHFNYGISLAAQGKLPEATTRFERAVQLKPDYVEALINLGNALGKSGKLQEATSQFRRAIEIQPENTLAYCGLGSAYSELGQMPEALQAFEQAEKFAKADGQLELVSRIRAQIGLLKPARSEPKP
jgi:Tfp pilus assembly protein PilF